jgi:hypothetical protein
LTMIRHLFNTMCGLCNMAGSKITPKFSSLTAPEHFELVPQAHYRTLNRDLCASTTKIKKAG